MWGSHHHNIIKTTQMRSSCQVFFEAIIPTPSALCERSHSRATPPSPYPDHQHWWLAAALNHKLAAFSIDDPNAAFLPSFFLTP